MLRLGRCASRAVLLGCLCCVAARSAGAQPALELELDAADGGVAEAEPPATDAAATPDDGYVMQPADPVALFNATTSGSPAPQEPVSRRRAADALYELPVSPHAAQAAADLGEVLARSPGFVVQRVAGFGGPVQLSLDGVPTEQLGVLLDGVPLRYAGVLLPIANLPVGLYERVDVYRGVSPIRFGVTALGGALDLVSSQTPVARGVQASYQYATYGTHRATLDARYRHEPSGIIARASGFFDTTQNDYDMDVQIPDDAGRLIDARVRRFHDAYHAYGANLELGVADRVWARRLTLRGFVSGFGKELQHDPRATVPYGEVGSGGALYGVHARYEVSLGPGAELELLAGYAHQRGDVSDKAAFIYDWHGQRVAPSTGGETGEGSRELANRSDGLFARGSVRWRVAPGHMLGVSVAPEYGGASWRERRGGSVDMGVSG